MGHRREKIGVVNTNRAMTQGRSVKQLTQLHYRILLLVCMLIVSENDNSGASFPPPPPILNVFTARPKAQAQEQAPSEGAFRVGQADAFRPMGHVHAACSSTRAGSGGGTGEPAALEADRQRLLVRQAGRGRAWAGQVCVLHRWVHRGLDVVWAGARRSLYLLGAAS